MPEKEQVDTGVRLPRAVMANCRSDAPQSLVDRLPRNVVLHKILDVRRLEEPFLVPQLSCGNSRHDGLAGCIWPHIRRSSLLPTAQEAVVDWKIQGADAEHGRRSLPGDEENESSQRLDSNNKQINHDIYSPHAQ
jgi:hypothetical protein